MNIEEANKALLDGAYKSNAAKVAKALENGADVNFRDCHGTTPLHAASFAGRSVEICKMLIERGADVEARESMGMTPLHFVAWDRRNLSVRSSANNWKNIFPVRTLKHEAAQSSAER